MSNAIKPIIQKDALYYRDLIYYLRYLAKLDFEPSEEIDARIRERVNYKGKGVTFKMRGKEITVGNESIFILDLFSIVATIEQKAGIRFKGFYEMSKYPVIVEETIQELEALIAELEKKPTLGLKKEQ